MEVVLMPRTFPWMLYASDTGFDYALKVDAVYVAMPERGWASVAVPDTVQYPRGWRPRAVIGVTAAGGLVLAICATTGCALWTGEVSEITYIDRSGQLAVATSIGKQAERTLKVLAV
jgi:hypothetical protein